MQTVFPFATAPDIIRSNQKDAYFQAVLLDKVSAILRTAYGNRFIHNKALELRALSDLLYLSLTTLLGNRTLGEEYTDIVQVHVGPQTRAKAAAGITRLPSLARRSAYILTSVVIPYGIHRLLPGIRRRLRAKLESSLQNSASESKQEDALPQKRRLYIRLLQTYALTHFDTVLSPDPLYACSLAIFYFTGAYYQLAKRLVGLRYIFTRHVEPSGQRGGYQLLGMLLVVQLAVQTYLHLRDTTAQFASAAAAEPNTTTTTSSRALINQKASATEASLNHQAYTPNNALLFTDLPASTTSATLTDSKKRLAVLTQTPVPDAPSVTLDDPKTMRWMDNAHQRKCTLCLEFLKDPSVTTCGHVFCWECIGEWLTERAECPLCRSAQLRQHLLPLRA